MNATAVTWSDLAEFLRVDHIKHTLSMLVVNTHALQSCGELTNKQKYFYEIRCGCANKTIYFTASNFYCLPPHPSCATETTILQSCLFRCQENFLVLRVCWRTKNPLLETKTSLPSQEKLLIIKYARCANASVVTWTHHAEMKIKMIEIIVTQKISHFAHILFVPKTHRWQPASARSWTQMTDAWVPTPLASSNSSASLRCCRLFAVLGNLGSEKVLMEDRGRERRTWWPKKKTFPLTWKYPHRHPLEH